MKYEDELDRIRDRQNHRGNGKRGGAGRSGSGGRQGGPAKGSRKAMAARRRRRKRRILIAEVLLLLVVLAGAWLFLRSRSKTEDGFWTIAVFGVDSRDGKMGKGALADVDMICSIDRATGEIKLVSVYRDTYLKIDQKEKGTYHKINEAYAKGGPEQAMAALSENLDLQIDDYVTFNWKTVAEAINILGGVDIELSESEFSYINGFITETVKSTGIGSHQLTSAGLNHLDGVQAVAYSRLRLMDTDFNRTERQREVVSKAMEKAKSADFSVLNNILVTVFPQLSTSLSVGDLIPMAQGISKYHLGETGGFPYSREAKKVGKMQCVIPTTLESNVIQLHEFLYGETDYTPSAAVRKISDRIAEETGLKGVGENAPTGKSNSGGGKKSAEEQPPETTAPESTEESSTSAATEAAEEETEEETEEKPTTEDGELVGPGAETEKGTKPEEDAGPGAERTEPVEETKGQDSMKETQGEKPMQTEAERPGDGEGEVGPGVE